MEIEIQPVIEYFKKYVRDVIIDIMHLHALYDDVNVYPIQKENESLRKEIGLRFGKWKMPEDDEIRDLASYFRNPERCRQKYDEAWAKGAQVWRMYEREMGRRMQAEGMRDEHERLRAIAEKDLKIAQDKSDRESRWSMAAHNALGICHPEYLEVQVTALRSQLQEALKKLRENSEPEVRLNERKDRCAPGCHVPSGASPFGVLFHVDICPNSDHVSKALKTAELAPPYTSGYLLTALAKAYRYAWNRMCALEFKAANLIDELSDREGRFHPRTSIYGVPFTHFAQFLQQIEAQSATSGMMVLKELDDARAVIAGLRLEMNKNHEKILALENDYAKAKEVISISEQRGDKFFNRAMRSETLSSMLSKILKEALIDAQQMHQSFWRKISIGAENNFVEGRLSAEQHVGIGVFIQKSMNSLDEIINSMKIKEDEQ